MAELFAYLDGFGAGGSLTKSILIVTAPTGSTVTVTKGSTTKTAMEKNGEWWFKNLENGEWTIRAELDGKNATETYNIARFGVYRKTISYRMTPEFTYTGDYEIVQDDDTPIADFASWKGNWKIRFLTSGDFTITNMHGFAGGGVIDVFLVGAGGSGGNGVWHDGYVQPNVRAGGAGGGYTKTQKNVPVISNTKYSVVIGSGAIPKVSGSEGTDGGSTSAFSVDAAGGHGTKKTGHGAQGGDGGSGGGNSGYAGATDGNGGTNAGQGQGTTTKEFAEATGKLYASGGSGASKANGQPNTGDGGSGGAYKDTSGGTKSSGGSGGSGIVVIRNTRT